MASCIAENPTRDLIIGGAGKLDLLSEQVAPRLTDRIMEALVPGLENRRGPCGVPATTYIMASVVDVNGAAGMRWCASAASTRQPPCIRWPRLRRSPGWASLPQP